MGCDTVYFGREVPAVPRNLMPPSSDASKRRKVSTKPRYLPKLYGVTSHEIIIFMLVTVTTLKLFM
jgi:hypothetical protein